MNIPLKNADGEKCGPNVEEYEINRIPTVVIEREDEEVARFVETESVPIAVFLAEQLTEWPNELIQNIIIYILPVYTLDAYIITRDLCAVFIWNYRRCSDQSASVSDSRHTAGAGRYSRSNVSVNYVSRQPYVQSHMTCLLAQSARLSYFHKNQSNYL